MGRWMTGVAAVVVLAGVMPVGAALAAPPAAPPSCAQVLGPPSPNDTNPYPGDSTNSPQDINDDGLSDVVVGVGAADSAGQAGAGVVDIRLSHGSSFVPQRIGQSFFTGLAAPKAGDHFGSAVALSDFDDQYCEDLAIGAPGADSGRGAVVLAFGSVDGISPGGAIRLVGRSAGEHFGSAIAASGSDVWVAAPDRTVSGQTQAGAVDHYRVVGGVATLVETLTENAPGVPGVAERGDRFGQVLAATRNSTLVVGEPLEDIGSAGNAGTVTVVFTSPSTHRLSVARTFSQNSPGVSGSAELGDHFGASVTAELEQTTAPNPVTFVAVGVPGENIGSLVDAGAVQGFTLAGTGEPKQAIALNQNSPGVPGNDHYGDRFGNAVLVAGTDAEGAIDLNLAIGAPGADVGRAADAGTAAVVMLTNVYHSQSGGVTVRPESGVLHQGPLGSGDTVGGTAQSGDHLGTNLCAIARPDATFQGDDVYRGGADLAITVPGEDHLGADSGDIAIVSSGPASQFIPVTNFQDTAGARAGELYNTCASVVSNGPGYHIT